MDAVFELFTELGGNPFKQAAGLSPAEQELLLRWRRGEVLEAPGLDDAPRAALFFDPGPDSQPDPDVPEHVPTPRPTLYAD